MAIKFGTDGMARAVIADEFTFENVRWVAQAYADVLPVVEPEARRRGVVVGYDTRFASPAFASEVARVLLGNGIPVALATAPCPTPALSWAVRDRGAAGGVMITASHNPPEYNGFKIKASYAGSALPDFTRAVEERLERNLREEHGPVTETERAPEPFDPKPSYLARLRTLLDAELIRRARGRVVVDSMYGSARGYLPELLEGFGIEVEEIHGEINPAFPGLHPEPIPPYLDGLAASVRDRGAALGLAVDGDGDRVGAVDASGRFVDPHRIFALLLRHLVEVRGWRGSVVKTFALTRMADRLAARYGLPFHQTPVGFKHVCELALREEVLIGGEESGGIGIMRHIPERDGILAASLLLEVVGAAGRPLAEVVEGLLREVGPHDYRRLDLRMDAAGRDDVVRRLDDEPPSDFAGFRVEEVDPLDGRKFLLGDHGWILIRPSGTEPLVRVYVEMDDPERVEAVLEAGRRWVVEGRT